MIALLDRSRLRKIDLPRAFMQDMLFPLRGRAGAAYSSSWGERDADGQRRFEATLRSFDGPGIPAKRGGKLRKDGKARVARRLNRTLGPEHADLFVALHVIQQATLDYSELTDVPFQLLWRATHGFKQRSLPKSGDLQSPQLEGGREYWNYSGAWKKKATRALDELARCEMAIVDRGTPSTRQQGEHPRTVTGPLLRIFWVDKTCSVAGRTIKTRSIERILWGPAVEYMMSERLMLTFRADEYFSIRSGSGRIAYLFAPAPAAARARDQSAKRSDGVAPSPVAQSSSSLLLKLGYAPEELSDRYRRHRLLLPLQEALDCRSLSNGHLCVSVKRHRPPNRARVDWQLSIHVSNRRPSGSSPVEDVTFLAAQEGGRSRDELYAALKRIPELDDREQASVDAIWPEATRPRAIAWARKAKALLPTDERIVFSDILAEVRMLKTEGTIFRKAPAAMAVGLIHRLLRHHEWPLPTRRTVKEPPT